MDGWEERDIYPREESNEEEKPLLARQHGNELEGIGCMAHGRLEGRDARCSIRSSGHLVWRMRLHRSIRHIEGAGDLFFTILVCHDGWSILSPKKAVTTVAKILRRFIISELSLH